MQRFVYAALHPTDAYSRGVLAGVSRFAGEQAGRWLFRWGYLRTIEPAMVEHLQGLIVPVWDQTPLAWGRARSLPMVNPSARESLPPDLPTVVPDNVAIGRLAAQLLRRRLVRAFAFAGPGNHAFTVLREQGFREALDGLAYRRLEGRGPGTGGQRLVEEVADLPRFTGIFAANDFSARHVLEAAAAVGRRIPEDLALIGVDRDADLTASLGVELTSIDPDAPRVGYEAARLLQRLMEGEPPPAAAILIAPGPLREGRSTLGFASDGDPVVAAACRLIEAEACSGLDVAKLAQRVGLGRRALEKRFRASLGASPAQEIRRRRLSTATELLRQTHLSVGEIAQRCGFADVFQFSTAFKKALGISPRAFRR